MNRRRISLLILVVAVAGLLLSFSLPASHVEQSALQPGSDYLVAYYPGITLADVTKTHGRFFVEIAGNVTIDRRDRSLRGHCKAAIFAIANSLWEHTGERWDFLFNTAVRCYPTSQEIVCSSPSDNRITLYADDSIVIPCRAGVTVVLGLQP